MSQTKKTLNQGQEAAANGFFAFLFGPEKELNIRGPGGVGKTYLMGYLIDEILPRYHDTCRLMGIEPKYTEVQMCATTNKAADVLGHATGRPSQTIHSFMNLMVRDDYTTGKSTITKSRSWKVHNNLIIFVDEGSMVDTPLRQHIMEGTQDCKVVYVGDHCQLAPVMEPISPIYAGNLLPSFDLTEPVRNAGQPALMAVCQQLRHTVETGEFYPIQVVPGVIDWLDSEAMQAEIDREFAVKNPNRILTYTNDKVTAINEYIRGLRNLPADYTVGEELINNSAITLPLGGGLSRMLSVEEEVEIESQDSYTEMVPVEDSVQLEIRYCNLKTFYNTFHNVPVPVDKQHFTSLLKYYQRNKNWPKYYHLKNTYPDLRPRDACTAYKAQGSTYHTVYIDLDDLSSCRNPNQAARLLYVAFSRAQQRVVLFGDLAAKYGGLIR